MIAVEAAGPAMADFSISYRISGAGWQPAYEAKLVTGTKPRVELSRRAEVRQSTGEDWSDVALTLSTSRVAGGAAAPDLPTQTVALFEPAAIAFEAQRQSTLQRAAPAPPGRAHGNASNPPNRKKSRTIDRPHSPSQHLPEGGSPLPLKCFTCLTRNPTAP